MSNLNKVIEMAMKDPSFKNKLITDPKSAVSSMGITLTSDEMSKLQSMDRSKLETGLDSRISKTTTGFDMPDDDAGAASTVDPSAGMANASHGADAEMTIGSDSDDGSDDEDDK